MINLASRSQPTTETLHKARLAAAELQLLIWRRNFLKIFKNIHIIYMKYVKLKRTGKGLK